MNLTLPQIYYGLHMVEGVAEYRPKDKEPYRLLALENMIKNMDPTFAGRPVYVDHVDSVDFAKIQEADGYVVESFFNKADGKHWAKFIVVTEKGKEAIRNGWKLSNAYHILEKDPGGTWHGVEYQWEAARGEYEHLAIVQNPRYAESVIMTPDEFKTYNKNKEADLERLQNSIEKETLMFFKKAKVDNSADLEQMSVTLPKSKKEVTLLKLVNDADEAELKENTDEKKEEGPVMANGDHMVKVGEQEMTVNELVEKHLEMSAPKNEDDKEEDKKENEAASEKKEEAAQNEATEEDEKKKENEDDKEEEKAANAAHFEALKNAEDAVQNSTSQTFELSSDRVARGKARYGSK